MAVKDLYDKACEAANKGNYGYAIELYREVLRLEPEYPGARLLLRGTERRRCAEQGNFFSTVLGYLKGLWPLIRASFAFSKPKKKLECFEDFLENNPNSIYGLLQAGHAARKADLIEAAVTIYKDVLSLKPENKGALQALGETLEENEQTKEALKYLSKLADLSPNDRPLQQRVKNMEAQAHMQETKMEEADSFRDMVRDKDFAEEAARYETAEERRGKLLEQAEKAVEDEPDNVNKIVRLAMLYEDAGQMDKALQLLKDCQKRMSDSYQLRERLGDLKLRICDEALKRVEQKLEEEPENEKLQQRQDKLKEKRLELAVKEHTWRVEQHPTDKNLRLKLGYALFENGEVEKAIGAFQQAAKDPRLEEEAACMMGRCFMEKGQCDLAAEQFRRAIRRHPDFDDKGMDHHYMLAEALEATGETGEALEIYKKIYTNDISFRDVADKVESLTA